MGLIIRSILKISFKPFRSNKKKPSSGNGGLKSYEKYLQVSHYQPFIF
jgi:hypothetical protein